MSNSDGRGGKGTELFTVTAKGAGSGKSTELALNVTIEPLAGTCNICPDNSSTPTYSNGANSVTTAFGTAGHFVFGSGTRAVRFLYSGSLGDSLTNRTLPPSESPTAVNARTFHQALYESSRHARWPTAVSGLDGSLARNKLTKAASAGRGSQQHQLVVVTHGINTWVMERTTSPSEFNLREAMPESETITFHGRQLITITEGISCLSN